MPHNTPEYGGSVCAIGLNNYIAKETSRNIPQDTLDIASSRRYEGEQFAWRLHQPSEPRKFNLFPSNLPPSILSGRRTPSPDSAANVTTEHTSNTLSTRERLFSRKARQLSLEGLEPMTTAQDKAMDSPTIPGRPALRDRSLTSPQVTQSARNAPPFAPKLSSTPKASLASMKASIGLHRNATMDYTARTIAQNIPQATNTNQAPPPRKLAPIVIPRNTNLPIIPIESNPDSSRGQPFSGSPPMVPPKSARNLVHNAPAVIDSIDSAFTMHSSNSSAPIFDFSPFPDQQRRPWTPATSNLSSLPSSAMLTSVFSTAPPSASVSSSLSSSNESTPPSRLHIRQQSDNILGAYQPTVPTTPHPHSHRRGESEASIMNRSRPKKRPKASPSLDDVDMHTQAGRPTPPMNQKAFDTLPTGYPANEAFLNIGYDELERLRLQAMGQADQFEVLCEKDVKSLSRELRALDERCSYLRKTHMSLRNGRQNFHERIVSYLRSPRTAIFSHESLLKQEEALKELDESIDGWVQKLGIAENRRLRVRQKLLEHVAAAVTIPKPIVTRNPPEKESHIAFTGVTSSVAPVRESVKLVETPTTPNTLFEQAFEPKLVRPKRCAPLIPAAVDEKSSSVVIDVKELPAIIQTLDDTAQPRQMSSSAPKDQHVPSMNAGRSSVESIRIYVETDVYGLLADVEAEMTRMVDKKEPVPTLETLANVSYVIPQRTRLPVA